MKPKPKLRIRQIVAGQWNGYEGLTFSILALATDGMIYRWSRAKRGWELYTTEELKEGAR
jgi:hypothetical protein